jgi:NADPH:quinone reductase-like Zn-dependent oxidoreductase
LEGFVEVNTRATQSKDMDVILNLVGGDYVPREFKALAAD